MNTDPKNLPRTLIVTDKKLSLEKGRALTQKINTLRQISQVELLKAETTEDELIEKIKATKPALVLTPWHLYLRWSKLEAFFGKTRSQGPTSAGYFADQLDEKELPEHVLGTHCILLDFQRPNAIQFKLMIQNVLHEKKRFGIKPFHDSKTKIYHETWRERLGQGLRLDTVLSFKEIIDYGWDQHAGSIRIALMTLWSLVYELGPGKSDLSESISSKPVASFQFAASSQVLTLRVCFTMSSWKGSELVANFWPATQKSTSSPQDSLRLIREFSDFMRIHQLEGTNNIELVVGFFPNFKTENTRRGMTTFWIGPISKTLVTESYDEQTAQKDQTLQPFPGQPLPKSASTSKNSEDQEAKEKALSNAFNEIRELKSQLREKNALIHEFKSGGVNVSTPNIIPDAESLLEAFEYRYAESLAMLEDIERQLNEFESVRENQSKVLVLRKRGEELVLRQKQWIKILAKFIQRFKKDTEERLKAS